jgi:ParB family chromosome partitioning protein
MTQTARVLEMPSAEGFREVPPQQLLPSPTNPRKLFDPVTLDELAASIGEKGLIAPIVVRPTPVADVYEIVDGERRYRAAVAAGLTLVPVVVRQLSDQDVLEIQLVANIQRDDLTPLEEAKGYRALVAPHRRLGRRACPGGRRRRATA